MKAKALPPLDVLRELFDYNPETGELHWKKDRNTNKVKGKRAGWKRNGYVVINYDRGTYYAHRLAYAIYHQEQLSPEVVIDHKDGDKSNNRISNLRKVDHSANNHNCQIKKNNTSGHRGVTYSRTAHKWQAKIMINRHHYNLGYYDRKEDAINARLQAESDYGVFVR